METIQNNNKELIDTLSKAREIAQQQGLDLIYRINEKELNDKPSISIRLIDSLYNYSIHTYTYIDSLYLLSAIKFQIALFLYASVRPLEAS